jgi:chorismate synthase
MTNGEEVRVRVGVKPLSTLGRPLESIDLVTGERADAAYERSDVTVVPAAGVVGEAMLALVLADAALDKFGGDSLAELLRNYRAYRDAVAWRSPR